MPFRPGRSGNPSGAPKGPRSLTMRIKAMAEKDAIKIVSSIIEGAKLGDVEARRLYLKYLCLCPS